MTAHARHRLFFHALCLRRAHAGTATARRAFTLVEVLVSVLILAVLMSAVSLLLTSVLRLRENSSAALDQGIAPARAAAVIERDLRQTLPPAGAKMIGPFVGQKSGNAGQRQDTLAFYTASGTLGGHAAWGDVQYVQYALEKPSDGAASGMDLVRSVTRNLLAPTTDDPEKQRLLRGVSVLQMDYYDSNAWNDHWDTGEQTNNVLPAAVRLHIEFADAGGGSGVSPIDITTELVCVTPTAATTTTTQ